VIDVVLLINVILGICVRHACLRPINVLPGQRVSLVWGFGKAQQK